MKKLLITLFISGLLLTPVLSLAQEHGGLDSIELSPISKTVKAGEKVTFTLTASDEQSNTWDISNKAVYQVNDPRGQFVANVYQAGKVGKWTISVQYGNFTAKTTIKVKPGSVYRLEINPHTNPEVILLGEKKQFQAKAFDRMSNLITKTNGLTWSTDKDLGTISQTGLFEARDIGEGKIAVSLNGVLGQINVLVREKTVLPPANPNNQNSAANTTNSSNANLNNTNQENNNQGQVAGIDTAKAAEVNTETKACQAWAWYWWLMIMIGITAVYVIYYYLIRRVKNGYWWIFPLLLLAGAVWFYYQYACHKQGWWPWVMIALAMMATLFRPKKYFEEPNQPTF